MTRLFATFVTLAALWGCTRDDVVHRALAPNQPVCEQILSLGRINQEPTAKSDNPAQCYLQTHELPSVERAPLIGAPKQKEPDWRAVAANRGRNLRGGDRYHLAFVEMADTGRLHAPAQLDGVKRHLRDQSARGKQNYVIAFVHGWRHDASLGDGDVRKFRTLLGYARAALNTRCVTGGTYCNAALTGVFVAWRGRSFAEPILVTDGQLNPFNLIVAPTLWDRKEKSDELGAGGQAVLAQVLDGVQGELSLDSGRAGADKFLIMGHSLGGNMLAGLMSERAATAIANHPVPRNGQVPRALRPPMGDLVVLINPAAEAGKWTALQQAMRDKVGLARADNQLTANIDGTVNDALWARLRPWRSMFPLEQRPVYMAITATENWSGSETEGRKVDFDSATGVLFPLAQRLAGAKTPEDRRAIGHLVPRYASHNTLNGPAIGATHELSVNQGIGQRATYGLSVQPSTSWCDPATGWLRAVRQDQLSKGWSFGDAWDYGLSAGETDSRSKAAENIARGINSASVQWRHALNLRAQPDRWSVVSGRSPFWNVRAMDTAIREHAGYVNYPMWCALNQLVLDDIGNLTTTDDTVDEVRTARRVIEVQTAISEASKAIDAATPKTGTHQVAPADRP